LARSDALALDPDLLPVPGRAYPPANRPQFGIFMDSAPDRWGRTLMQRREAMLASKEKRSARALTEWDYLLGVHDHSRLGALRFRADANSPFLDNSAVNAARLHSRRYESYKERCARSRKIEQTATHT
jgi:serine/threonine-protein kinase HipA